MGASDEAEGGPFITPQVFQRRLAKGGMTVHLETVRRWCRAKRLDVRRLPGGWQIRAREVERVLEAGVDASA